MRLARLQLDHFRSYTSAELAPDPGLTLIAGPNGAGKTNLLESIWVAVSGRSHRTAADAELVAHGAQLARVELDLADAGAPAGVAPTRVELVLPGLNPPPGLRRRLTVNGVARRQASVSDTLRAVLFRPEEMLLLVGAPSERRRFLDAILGQRSRATASDLADLGRVLAQRNALLRAIRAEETDASGLAVWDEQLAIIGGRVMAARLAVVDDLAERIGPLHDAVAPADEQGDRVGPDLPRRPEGRLARPRGASWGSRCGSTPGAWRPPSGPVWKPSARRRSGTGCPWPVPSATTWA